MAAPGHISPQPHSIPEFGMDVFFVGGINNEREDVEKNAQALAEKSNQAVIPFWDATGRKEIVNGIPFAQLKEDFICKLKQSLLKRRSICIIAHSQGALLARESLQKISECHRKSALELIDVYTFGGVTKIPDEYVRKTKNYRNYSDNIYSVGERIWDREDSFFSERFWKKLFGLEKTAEPFSYKIINGKGKGHQFIEGYVDFAAKKVQRFKNRHDCCQKARLAIVEEKFQKFHSLSYQWMNICAHLYPYKIPLTFLETWLETFKGEDDFMGKDFAREQILETLTNAGVIRFDKHSKVMTLYIRGQEIIRQGPSFPSFEKPALQLIAAVGNTFSETDSYDWRRGELWDPHARKALATITSIDPKVRGDMVHALGKSAYFSNNFEAALKYWEEAVLIREYYEKDHRDIAWSLDHLGNASSSLAQYEKARKLHEEALAMRRRIYNNGDHADIACSLNHLGVTLSSLAQYEEARKFCKEALDMCRRIYNGSDHPDIACSLNHLGKALFSLRQYEKAQKLFKEALEMCRRIYNNGDHPDIALSLNNVGATFWSLQKYEHARKLHEEALAMHRRIYNNGDHPDIALSLNNVGATFWGLQKYEHARKLHEEALAMRRRIYNNGDHPDFALSLNHLGVTFWSLKKYELARKLQEEGLEMCRRIYNNGNHPDIACSLNHLGVTFSRLQKYEHAQELHKEALEMYRRIYNNSDHSDIACSLNHLGVTFSRLQKHELARKFDEEALAIHCRIHRGRDHPDIVCSLNNLGMTFANLQKYQMARKFHKEALDMCHRLNHVGCSNITLYLNHLTLILFYGI